MSTTRSFLRLSRPFVLALLLSPLAAGSAAAQGSTVARTELFNGKDLTGWRAAPAAGWGVVDGAIVFDGAKGASLTSERELGDFQLTAEFQAPPESHASVLLRGAGLVGLRTRRPAAWSSLTVVLIGERATIVVAGLRQAQDSRMPNATTPGAPIPARGPLVLTTDGAVRWRNIRVREIGAAEANAVLARRDDAGFVSVFNGKRFDGWAGPIDNYQIIDGALFCKPGSGGTIYTKTEYRDFAVRLEIQLPPGGNNGLAIRYPGTGDAAYVGMTELQVLDNTAAKYATLDPRQFHGSAYGMVPAHKGYQRPVGEWNFQEVTVRGSTIVVELNGTRILDADLSTVKTFMADSPHPGKDRVAGHFGFAGHGDPVRFRNVQIKPLP
jgi:hypothetical protein